MSGSRRGLYIIDDESASVSNDSIVESDPALNLR